MENAVLFLRQRLRLGEPVAASVRLRSAPRQSQADCSKAAILGTVAQTRVRRAEPLLTGTRGGIWGRSMSAGKSET